MKHFIIIGAAALLLTGCATASQSGAMVPAVSEQSIVTPQSKLFESVSLGEVGGGKETNPLWTSQVSSENFAEALEQTFAAHAMLSSDEGDYRLDAELVKLKQPFAGTSMSVTSDVKYTLTNIDTGAVVFDEVISEKYTAAFSDSFVAVKRLQLANEGSIKSNLSTLMEKLISSVDGVSEPIAWFQTPKTAG